VKNPQKHIALYIIGKGIGLANYPLNISLIGAVFTPQQ
jgi:hypothetical protein